MISAPRGSRISTLCDESSKSLIVARRRNVRSSFSFALMSMAWEMERHRSRKLKTMKELEDNPRSELAVCLAGSSMI